MCDNSEPISNEVIHKEIDLIQNCISRMEKNSFLLKGWNVSLMVAVLAILPKNISSKMIILILSFILISFWYLDAFFLKIEKKYRKLYEKVIKDRRNGNIDNLYSLDIRNISLDKKEAYTMKSDTLLCFYGIQMLLIIIFFVIKAYPIILNMCYK